MKILKVGKEEILIGLLAIASYIICIINDFHAHDWIVLNLLGDGFSFGDFLSMENPGRFRPLTNILLYIRYLLFGDTAFFLCLKYHCTRRGLCNALQTACENRVASEAALLSSVFFAAYFQLDHIPGRTIIGPPMIYRLNFKGTVIAFNDPVRGPINIEKTADSLYNEGVPIVVFDYRDGRMVEATEEYIYERKTDPDLSE